MAAQKKSAAKKTARKAVVAAPKAAPKAVAKAATKRSKLIKPDAPARAKVAIEAATVEGIAAPATRSVGARADQARTVLSRATAASEQIRQTVADRATVNTTGALEFNGKVLTAWRVQSEMALDLWRQTLAAGSLSEAIRLQTSGARQAFEAAADHWKDVAETATRWFGTTVKPMPDRTR